MTACVLGIDLASARWSSNGTALLHFDIGSGAFTRVVPGAITWPDAPLTPESLADAVHACALREGVRAVALDGPPAWRSPHTSADLPGVGRRCEYACRTQGKTGVYPQAYPGTQFGWIDFCVRVFDALLMRPGVRLAERESAGAERLGGPRATGGAVDESHAGAGRADRPYAPVPDADESDAGACGGAGYVILETFPTATWRASGLTPLPAKAKRPDVQGCYDRLAAAYALPPVRVSSHDDLQAIVAALAGVGVAGGPVTARPHGEACVMAEHAEGARRVEGFIWDAAPRR